MLRVASAGCSVSTRVVGPLIAPYGTVLVVNDHISLGGIPVEAHQYSVNGRTPLAWCIDRYKITQDRESGIVNDPNGWFDDPRDLIATIRRIVHVSVETVRIVEGLPDPFGLAKGTQRG